MRLSLVAAAALGFAAIAGPAVRNQAPDRTWIADATIVSPERLDRVEKGSVLIEGGRIAHVEWRAGAPAPSGAAVVSGAGQFLIPGLIDSHVHLAAVPGMDVFAGSGPAASMPEVVNAYFAQLPRSYLYFGFTTLVDLAVIDRRVLDEFRRAPLGPDLFDCGPSLPFANGYPMSFAPPALRFALFPNFIHDPEQAASIPAEYKPEEHTPAAAVARVRRAGGVCVKTYFERGFGRDRNLPVLGRENLVALRKAATDAALVLMIHANAFEAQKFAVDGDVDVIAHGLWNWGDLDGQRELPVEVAQLLDRVAQKKIGYQATIQVLEGLRAYFDPDYLRTPAVARVIPADLLAWFESPAGQWFKREVAGDDAPDVTVRQRIDQGPLRRVRQVVAYLARKDASFLLGSDTPSAPTYGNLPGLNGYLEIRQLQRAGLSLEQIFRAATINNARRFKLDAQVGTIEEGKAANLVLLKRSPLESIDAYDSISTVWIHGRAAARDSLAVMSSRPAVALDAPRDMSHLRKSSRLVSRLANHSRATIY